MAETVKPETERDIADYLDDQFNFNKISKALRALRLLNLVVIKRRRSGLDLVELHPLVRQFIRQNFKPMERASYIKKIIRTYERMIGRERQHLQERPHLTVLQYWTQNAELDISVGNFKGAFAVLAEVSGAFESSAFPREFARVVRPLLSKVDWVAEHARDNAFELVFATHLRILSYFGEHNEVDGLLGLYEGTVADRDSRYIQYCRLRTFCYWVRGEFGKAVEWGGKGKDLIESSGVDTEVGPGLTYTLALAQRDGGQAEAALSKFLDGRKLSEVIDPEELDEARGEQHYGNIGRCLHLVGQIEPALVCYQKSALIIERNTITESVTNQAYIRMWIGELLVGRSEFQLAATFLRAAIRRWERLAPSKAEEAMAILKQIEGHLDRSVQLSNKEAERICLDWILGRDIDFSRSAFGR
jgi:tetratricopeptide (TPR) repeat protein